MFAVNKERYGCSFCREHFINRSVFNNHLDSYLPEVTSTRQILPAPRDGQHFLPIIRAVRRRGKRGKAKDPVSLERSEYDCCNHWRLFERLYSYSDVTRFVEMARKTKAQWKATGDAFVDDRAFRAKRRSLRNDPYLDTESDADDTYIPHFPLISGPMTQQIISSSIVSQNDAGSTAMGYQNASNQRYQGDVRRAVSSNATSGSRSMSVAGPSGSRAQHQESVHGKIDGLRTGSMRMPKINTQPAFHLAVPPVRPLRGPDKGKGKSIAPPTTPPVKQEIEIIDLMTPESAVTSFRSIVIVRELGENGRLVVLRETSLAQAISIVQESFPKCIGLKDELGVITEDRWEQRGKELTVVIDWAW